MNDYDASRNLSRAELDLLIAGVREMVERRAKDWNIARQVAYFNHHPEPLRDSYKLNELEALLAKLQIFFGDQRQTG